LIKNSQDLNTALKCHNDILEVLGTCHSLSIINNSLIGDILDKKMFLWTDWTLEENKENKYDSLVISTIKKKKSQSSFKNFEEIKKILENDEDMPEEIGIIKRFEFSSQLQRMSVVVKNLTENKFRLNCKGSPEKIRELCNIATVPEGFHRILNHYTSVRFYLFIPFI
jgi:cation-transporting P-type ATPase 13A2